MNDLQEIKMTGLEIAVIGMAGRFPGARNIDEFWNNLKSGIESIMFFSDVELSQAGDDYEELRDPNYVKAKGIIEDIENFDASFFKYTPVEATILDPQIRVFLETAWQAVENAGYNTETYKGKIGVYSGASPNFFWEALAQYSKEVRMTRHLPGTLIDKDYLSMITSYKLNLKGPSFTFYTACSTSLVAVDLACRALLTAECEMALAGGVSVNLPKKHGYYYQEGMIYSRDGHCRTFDANATGTIFGQGVGVVVLKPLDQVLVDRDHIWAVIKSSFVNNDGMEKVAFTAPSAEGQAVSIQSAMELAEIEPESIRYVEAHGTGTILGDPIEIEALSGWNRVNKRNYCAIGSVKTNVGHLDCAAGVTGLIKTILALKNRIIPPSLHFSTVNPKIDFENSPFYVNTKMEECNDTEFPIRAAINSLGIGGTNAHVILEEAPKIDSSTESREWQLILFSARTNSALEMLSLNFKNFLMKNPAVNLADAAYTLHVGRRAFESRKMMVCSTVDEAIELLAFPDPQRIQTSVTKTSERPIIFMFPGQGSQYVNMGLDLYRRESEFRIQMDRCFDILNSLIDYDIKEIIYPASPDQTDTGQPPERKTVDQKARAAGTGSPMDINQTEIAQPIIFLFSYALAKLLMKWGFNPHSMIGHSIGEYVAACLSGVFSLEDALKIVVLRGKLMQELPGGSMMSVSLPEGDLKRLLNEDIALAAVNGPANCSVSGDKSDMADFAKLLDEKGHEYRQLHTSHAFHSKMMEPIMENFAKQVSLIKLKEPQIPYISNVSGTWISIEEAKDPAYWSTHIRETVRFSDGITALMKEENAIFIEVGPGHVLSTLAKQRVNENRKRFIENLVRHPKEKMTDDYFLYYKIGKLWLYGRNINWDGYYSEEKRHRIPLPTYPFEGKRYWIDGNPYSVASELITGKRVKKNENIASWFYMPSWKSTKLPVLKESFELSCYLLFTDDLGLGARLKERLEIFGQDVIVVRKGPVYSRESIQDYTINPERAEDYDALLMDLRSQKRLPDSIVHMWSFNRDGVGKGQVGKRLSEYDRVQHLSYYSILFLLQAIGKKNYNDKFKLTVVSNNIFNITGDSRIIPEKATLLGPVKVIPKEYPNISCRCIDFDIWESAGWEERFVEQLYEELTTDTSDEMVGYRNTIRWIQNFEPIRWEKTGELIRYKKEGVYLITGGLGGIGIVLAEYLAKTVQAKLILTGRAQLPAREAWDEWLLNHNDGDPISTRIRRIQRLEELGAGVVVENVDVADFKQMRKVIKRIQDRFGRINGVIHCAGVADYGGVIQRRNPEASESVLVSKVKGTMVLDSFLRGNEPDFLVLCSSISSILGPFGEVAYCAANSFLDAFANYRNQERHNTLTVSINWDGWQEVGMAVDAIKKKTATLKNTVSQSRQVRHPLLNTYTRKDSNNGIFDTILSANKYWVLNEHRVMGNAVLVGTAYLEMARAGFEIHTQKKIMEIRDVFFINPFIIGDKTEIKFRLILQENKAGSQFFFMSQSDPGKEAWRPHSRGGIAAIEPEAPVQYDLAEIRSGCSEKEITIPEKEFKPFEGFVGTSQRWNCLRQVYLGKRQGLAQLELPGTYEDETADFTLHPALLDIATVFLMGFVKEDEEEYLPFSYKKLKVKGHLPRKVFSYARYVEGDDSSKVTLKFNISILDEQGLELVEIEEFTVLKVSEEGQAITNEMRDKAHFPSALSSIDSENTDEVSAELLKLGLLSSEGVDVFSRVVGGTFPQVIISTQDLMNRIEMHKRTAASKSSESLKETDLSEESLMRPDLDTEYVAPRNDTEQTISNILCSFLGLVQIGIHDDFFDIGLDSLKALNVLSRIKDKFKIEVPLAEIFNYSTIAKLAGYIESRQLQRGGVLNGTPPGPDNA